MATKKTTKKSTARTKTSTARRKAKSKVKKRSKKTAGQTIAAARAEFLKKLAAQPNVKFLSREESQAFFENVEFDGCIARPKNPTNPDTGGHLPPLGRP